MQFIESCGRHLAKIKSLREEFVEFGNAFAAALLGGAGRKRLKKSIRERL
jgi:hypothetical protein